MTGDTYLYGTWSPQTLTVTGGNFYLYTVLASTSSLQFGGSIFYVRAPVTVSSFTIFSKTIVGFPRLLMGYNITVTNSFVCNASSAIDSESSSKVKNSICTETLTCRFDP